MAEARLRSAEKRLPCPNEATTANPLNPVGARVRRRLRRRPKERASFGASLGQHRERRGRAPQQGPQDPHGREVS